MIRSLFCAIALIGFGAASIAQASDLPDLKTVLKQNHIQKQHSVKISPRKSSKMAEVAEHLGAPKKVAEFTREKAVKKAPKIKAIDAPDVHSTASISSTEQTHIAKSAVGQQLAWSFKPLVANADGSKKEGSASLTGSIAVETPGAQIGPLATLELSGYIVKTGKSTIRVDIQIGTIQRSVLWDADKVESGPFKMVLTEKMQPGQLPATLPASAIAFVSKVGSGSVALISLEKVTVSFAKPKLASK